ncbi:MAG: hypothetical protein U0133_11220 [Gemmatimonadales bacterium]
MNSRWTRLGGAALAALLAAGCGGRDKAPAAPASTPDQSAQLLGRELADIVDRIMSYRSAHRNSLPASLRAAGIDSLTPVFSREYRRQGSDPFVTIRFRNPAGHPVTACSGTNMVLEDAMLHAGRFEIACELADGGTRTFAIEPPALPKKDD